MEMRLQSITHRHKSTGWKISFTHTHTHAHKREKRKKAKQKKAHMAFSQFFSFDLFISLFHTHSVIQNHKHTHPSGILTGQNLQATSLQRLMLVTIQMSSRAKTYDVYVCV